MIFCYMYRSVPYPVIIREASSYNRHKQMLRAKVRDYSETVIETHSSKLCFSIKSFIPYQETTKKQEAERT